MRRTAGHPGHRSTLVPALPLFGDAPQEEPARERQHDPCERLRPLEDLCDRADRLLAAVQELARESDRGPGLQVERIDAVGEQIGALQAVFVDVAGLELHLAQVAELGGARRSITDALVLTLELLERAR